jgi:hypothetical protein
MTDRARRAIDHYMAANPRGKHGSVSYDLADFGIDPAERSRSLRFYRERFDISED